MRKSTIHLVTEQAFVCAIGIALVVLASGIVYSLYLGDTIRFPDGLSYAALAKNIVENHSYSKNGVDSTAFRPPGYPAALSVAVRLGGGITAFRILNYVALSISIILVFLIVRKQAGPIAALIGAAQVACYPVLFYAGSTVFPQAVASCVFLAIIWLYCGNRISRSRDALVVGLLFGILLLVRPTFVFLVAFVCIWLILAQKQRALARVGIIVTMTLLVLCPWQVRSYRLFNSFVFVSTNGGLNLLLGNSENTTPNAGSGVDISFYRSTAREMSETERDSYYTGAAIDYVAKHGARSLCLYAGKFLNYFNYRNNLTTKSEEDPWKDRLMLLTYGLLLVLASARLAMVRKWRLTEYEKFAYLLYFLNGAFSALFFTRIRFRIPFDFLLITICAIFLARCLGVTKAPGANQEAVGR
jgi:4-amino-4-deoxy-L-arabinose transferase-like glycosyltransferase